ncbi:hypothetical protein FA15DRAFT_296255 [Coprinopsis marcescibilis]|uniref:Uncharacterized protein n=1 Tax=Coprinopsis marcescibilis TaxID=230819 RepID=A0A5C3KD79_COPMA|nr:hypothetical protein FA15DRAFT_296255 [Coprinopsis marcescibilis]
MPHGAPITTPPTPPGSASRPIKFEAETRVSHTSQSLAVAKLVLDVCHSYFMCQSENAKAGRIGEIPNPWHPVPKQSHRVPVRDISTYFSIFSML